jgi:hypothetical protein
MTAANPPTAHGLAGQPSPAGKLAGEVKAALATLRQAQREAADVTKGRTENTSLLIVVDDLGVIVSDLELVHRDLQGLAR